MRNSLSVIVGIELAKNIMDKWRMMVRLVTLFYMKLKKKNTFHGKIKIASLFNKLETKSEICHFYFKSYG